MAYGVVIPNKIEATNREVLNRTVVSASAIENGSVFALDSKSAVSGYGEVWTATWPTTGSLTGVWMAMTPEVVNVAAADGTVYRGINADPRNFTNSASAIIDAVKLQPGDIITLSSDAFTGAYAAGSTHATAAFQNWQLQWRAFDPGDALTLKYLSTTYIPIGSGSAIGDTRLAAYKCEVIRN